MSGLVLRWEALKCYVFQKRILYLNVCSKFPNHVKSSWISFFFLVMHSGEVCLNSELANHVEPFVGNKEQSFKLSISLSSEVAPTHGLFITEVLKKN